MIKQHSTAMKNLRLWHKEKFMNGKYFLILISFTVLVLYSQYRSISIRVLQCHDTTMSIHSFRAPGLQAKSNFVGTLGLPIS